MLSQIANSFVLHNVLLFINYAVSKKELNDSVDSLESRIIGGVPVPVESSPSTVKFYNFGAMCSGTIINSWCVLTAAHCFEHNNNVYDMMIEVGARYVHDHTGEVYGVLNFVIHNDYNKVMPFACDIALIFVSRPIQLGNKAKKAVLAYSQNWMNQTEKNILVSGWGWTKYGGPISESGLMQTHLNFVPSKDCERMHQLSLSPDMFCLYGGGVRDTCRGDSGGGVMWNDTVIGVVSHGDGCAKKDKPSVYMSVYYFRQWIQTQVEHFFQNACQMLEDRENLNLQKYKVT